ncbi:MAG: hypothetical protein QNJ84_10760 [Alphaproteobacteria bacterium]|nr:hypothetical protein [Alphaproteobacteria bacterium]
MALNIDTFDNRSGGRTFFKALGHPLAVEPARALSKRLQEADSVAIYDPLRQVEPFDALYPLTTVDLTGVFIQDIDDLGHEVLGLPTQPVTDLKDSGASLIFVPAFDAERLVEQIADFVPADATLVTLDDIKIEPAYLTNHRRYLDPLNFATNFAFFRDQDGRHTRLVTANYWGGYGAKSVSLWLQLFDESGRPIAEWTQQAGPANGTIVIDSQDVRARLDLPEFCGQLFLHVIGAAGHEVVKYALDTYGDAGTELSCTHDANAWPADLYAGLPAPEAGETVVLWVQNSHPTPIPAKAIGLNRMGREGVSWLDREVPGFGSYALDVADLLPGLSWPEQIEIRAGKHFVRPRYEIRKANGRNRISHPNVQRVDLKPDPKIPDLSNLMGKGYLLPAPVLPPSRYRSEVLPTPMSTAQKSLPIGLLIYDADGREVAEHSFGDLPRDHDTMFDLGAAVNGGGDPSRAGHCEIVYDFREGGEADGWLHGLFRYTDLETGHAAETSFGAHMFNHILTYKDEPQSYASRPPGLSTRLFLRLGKAPADAFCQLIYCSSTTWAAQSNTNLALCGPDGSIVAERTVHIPLNGSLMFRHRETFTEEECAQAGDEGYILIRDRGCRLFGYHGLIRDGESFSLDHMFGF